MISGANLKMTGSNSIGIRKYFKCLAKKVQNLGMKSKKCVINSAILFEYASELLRLSPNRFS